MVPIWAQAGGWGLVAGGALVLGAAVAYFVRVPPRVIAGIMAFGSGVLISALAFELVEKAYETGGLAATAGGFLCGAAVYTAANWLLAKRGAKNRKRSGSQPGAKSDEKQPTEGQEEGSGAAIAVGALLDGIPESIVIGLSLLGGGAVSLVTVGAIFLSNFPEGLSSASGMKKSGRGAMYIFGVWGAIAVACGLSALAGYALFGSAGVGVTATITAFAAGAILAMLADTMIPEAFEADHTFTGLLTVLGFLAGFALDKVGGG